MASWKECNRTAPLLAVSCLILLMSGELGRAQPAAATWRTGEAFRRQLDRPVGLTWSANPLRNALTSLSHHQRLAIWLDRRVDPDQPVEFSTADTSLETALEKLARQLQLGVCYVGPVAYFGPESLTSKLPTVAALRRQEAENLPADLRRRVLAAQPSQWQELAVPRELLTQTAAQAGVSIQGLEQVPHDLWPATELPPLPWTDRLSLLLAGFDLTFQFVPEQAAIRLQPIPAAVSLQRTYTLSGNAASVVRQLRELFPEAHIQAAPPRLRVAGSFQDHERMSRLLRGESVRQKKVVAGEKRYTLKVENQPLGGVVRALADRLDLQVEVDPDVEGQWGQLISFQVEEVSLDELLQTMLMPLGLRARVEAQTLAILPSESR